MSRLDLGLTPQERRERDHVRRERNCVLAITIISAVGALLLLWFGPPP